MTLTAPSSTPEEMEPAGSGTADPGLILLLRRASSMIDSMWHSARDDGGESVHLAEASQGVHRALIALSSLERSALSPGARAGG